MGEFIAVDLDGDGAHPAAWRDAGRPPGSVLSGRALRASVTAAEAAGFVLATFEDGPLPPSPEVAGRLEAGTRAAFSSTITHRIGLAPVLHTTTTEPFHLATQLASLDHASRGRAAWVVGAAIDADSLATVGAATATKDAWRQEIADVVVTARLLWDSWQDDAVLRDVATGRYLDADRVHHLDFRGATFSVKGPLITPRPPQGQVVVIAPSALEIDEHADIVLVGDSAQVARAREAGVPLVFADVEVALDAPEEPAADRVARLDEFASWAPTSRIRHVGSVESLRELLASLREKVDGVRLLPAVQATDLPLLAELPELAGPPLPGETLRERLGLPRPVNRFVNA